MKGQLFVPTLKNVPELYIFQEVIMSQDYPSKLNGTPEQEELHAQLDALVLELETIQQKTINFENILRSHLENLLIEEQELTVLYKLQKAAKKKKRQHQKKRGKDYRVVEGLQSIGLQKTTFTDPEEQLEKKRLYREAMLFVHPDKFSMQADKLDLATAVTTKLIDIYSSGDLETLRAYHAHIFQGNELLPNHVFTQKDNILPKDNYLQLEIDKLTKKLEAAKNRHTYKVLLEYENPMIFLEELKTYYEDRLFKLRKRTRKG
ncbi:hypothetical protein OO009_10775 [Flavobacteriaceae bacterium KMM 6897]|nr:hypothetical protein [Flavobacteriaceae bacterium KMM 6897]MEB8344805.1 hypothetical protein [Flavobacteriaceae bacterium KMM 6898]